MKFNDERANLEKFQHDLSQWRQPQIDSWRKAPLRYIVRKAKVPSETEDRCIAFGVAVPREMVAS